MKRTATTIIVCIGVLFIGFFIGSRIPQTDTIKEKPWPKEGKFLGVYIIPNGKGEKQLEVLMRRVRKIVVTDSTTNKDKIIEDTISAYPRVQARLDSVTHKPILDSTGAPLVDIIYYIIGNDSVNWNVSRIDFDTLMRKEPGLKVPGRTNK